MIMVADLDAGTVGFQLVPGDHDPCGGGNIDHPHVTALNAMAITATAAARGPHRRKERIPPGETARAAAAALRGDQPTPTSSGGRTVVDLSSYERAAHGRNTLT